VFRIGTRRGRTYIGGPDRTLTFSTRGGDSVVVPGAQQLHEIVHGIHRSRDDRVTLEELERYLQSARPIEWSLDALVKHAEEMRKKE
jgi:hypothetical protein